MSIEGECAATWADTAYSWYETFCETIVTAYGIDEISSIYAENIYTFGEESSDRAFYIWEKKEGSSLAQLFTACGAGSSSASIRAEKIKALPTTEKELRAEDLYARIKKSEATALLQELEKETTPISTLKTLVKKWVNMRELPAQIILAHKAYLHNLITKNQLAQLCLLNEAKKNPDHCSIVEDNIEEFLKTMCHPVTMLKINVQTHNSKIRMEYKEVTPLDKASVRYDGKNEDGTLCSLMKQQYY